MELSVPQKWELLEYSKKFPIIELTHITLKYFEPNTPTLVQPDNQFYDQCFILLNTNFKNY